MKKVNQLMREITQLTYNIETNYPELYQHLGETPITISSEGEKEVNQEVLADYLDSLKKILKHYIEEEGRKEK